MIHSQFLAWVGKSFGRISDLILRSLEGFWPWKRICGRVADDDSLLLSFHCCGCCAVKSCWIRLKWSPVWSVIYYRHGLFASFGIDVDVIKLSSPCSGSTVDAPVIDCNWIGLIVTRFVFLTGFSTPEQHRLGNAVPAGSLGVSGIGPPPYRFHPGRWEDSKCTERSLTVANIRFLFRYDQMRRSCRWLTATSTLATSSLKQTWRAASAIWASPFRWRAPTTSARASSSTLKPLPYPRSDPSPSTNSHSPRHEILLRFESVAIGEGIDGLTRPSFHLAARIDDIPVRWMGGWVDDGRLSSGHKFGK